MKRIFLSMAAVSAAAIALPVAAQSPSGTYPSQRGSYQYPDDGYANDNVAARIQRLQERIQEGVRSGAISRQEAMPLRQQLRQLIQIERQYSRNGLTREERVDLQQRIRDLRQRIRMADGGMRGRDDPFDRDDYGQSGQYGLEDRNNDGFDDRDYNRNGRWEDDVQDERYEQPAQRGGLGGMLEGLLGGGGLRVGQRASGNLYGVPAEYRNQFRDRNDVYYRSDGRSIYEIDARTQTVTRVYPMER